MNSFIKVGLIRKRQSEELVAVVPLVSCDVGVNGVGVIVGAGGCGSINDDDDDDDRWTV